MEMEWNESLSVGDATIDEQHKTLFAHIEQLLDQVIGGQGETVINETIVYLDRYITEHFSHEEKYMKEHGYPELDWHKEIHTGFSKEYDDLKKEVAAGGTSRILAERLGAFLSRWWVNHVRVVDQKYHEYIDDNFGCHPMDEPPGYHQNIQPL